MQQLHVVGHTMEVSATMVEPMREDEEEEEEEEGEGMGEYRRKASSSTEHLAPRQAPALPWAIPMVPEFWAAGSSIWVARRGLPAS